MRMRSLFWIFEIIINTALFTFSPVPTHSFTPVIIKIILTEKMCPYADRKDADPPTKPDGPGLSYGSMYFFLQFITDL